jgi:tetratricopeptide (TPR) repeat protein
MKRLLILSILMFISSLIFGQTSKLEQVVTEHYKVYSDVSETYASDVAQMMEAALELYNTIFHFDLTKLETPFKITIFSTKAGFDRYLQKLLGQTREDFVYIHYSDMRKCELVGFKKKDMKDFTASLLHQGLIQCIKTFIPSVPFWISEGVAAYIETSTYSIEEKTTASESAETEVAADSESVEDTETTEGEEVTEETEPVKRLSAGTFTLNKSLAWLSNLKALIKGEDDRTLLSLSDLLTIDKETAISKIDIFYPQSWGLVYFMLNTDNKNYNRLFWDSLNSLDPSLTLKENSLNIKNKVFKWIDHNTFNEHFTDYILSLKTFNELVTEGLDFYNNNELEKAEENFLAAIDLKPGHYFSYYYCGLIAYARKEYYTAEEYYLKALDLGSDKALTYYALGVNAYADNNYENAIVYLNDAKKENSEKYQQKVETILNRIESETKETEDFMDDEETDVDIETGGA